MLADIFFIDPLSGPTLAERLLLERYGVLDVTDCTPIRVSSQRRISGSLISALLRGKINDKRWPHLLKEEPGLRLIGASIVGLVNLSELDFVAVKLYKCYLLDGISFYHSRASDGISLIETMVLGPVIVEYCQVSGHLTIDKCTVFNNESVAVRAYGLNAKRFNINGSSIYGTLLLNFAAIDGPIQANMSRFYNGKGIAINAWSMSAYSLELVNSLVVGQISIHKSSFDGEIAFMGGSFLNPGGDSIVVTQCKAESLILNGALIEGLLNLHYTELRMQFSANGARFSKPSHASIWAQAFKASAWYMNTYKDPQDNEIAATVDGLIDLTSAEFSGSLSMNGITLSGTTAANGAALRGEWLKARNFSLQNANITGRLELSNAQILGQIVMDSSNFYSNDKLCINAAHLEATEFHCARCIFDGSLILTDIIIKGFVSFIQNSLTSSSLSLQLTSSSVNGDITIDSSGFDGKLELSSTQVGGSVRITNTSISHRKKPSLVMQRMIVSESMSLDVQISEGYLDISYTRVDGDADFRELLISRDSIYSEAAISRSVSEVNGGKKITGSDNYSAIFTGMEIGGELIMPERLCSDSIRLDLVKCDVYTDSSDGWFKYLGQPKWCFLFWRKALPRNEIPHISLSGFVCNSFSSPSGSSESKFDKIAEERVKWLSLQPDVDLVKGLNPQPWRMTAATLRRQGYDAAADKVLAAYAFRERLAHSSWSPRRIGSKVLSITSSYGFEPWLAGVWSIGLIVLFSIFFSWANIVCHSTTCTDRLVFSRVRTGDVSQDQYPSFNSIVYSFENFVPFLDFGQYSFWAVNKEARREPLVAAKPEQFVYLGLGWFVYMIVIIERIIGASFIGILIAGLTGLISRRDL